MTNANSVPLDTKTLGKESQQMFDWFKKRIKGQDRAVEYVVRAWALRRLGLQDPNRPIFSALFLGPSGVGKTLTAELLAEYFFQNRNGFTKIDCANMKQSHQVALLMGSPPGYIGFQDPNGPDQESLYPILSQWNIDRHHFESLRRRHTNELQKINQRGNEVRKKMDSLEQREKSLEEMRAHLEEIKETVEKFERIVRTRSPKSNQRSGMIANEYRTAVRELKKYRTIYNKLKELYDGYIKKIGADHKIIDKESDAVMKEFNAAKRRGLVYDHDMPTSYYSIILFDEIEKAHEDLFNILLAITDKGHLQLSNGKMTNLRNSFIFMTGNIASDQITDILSGGHIGFRQQKKDVMDKPVDQAIYEIANEEAQKTFQSAFLGRLDRIVVFRPLGDEAMSNILDIYLEELHKFFTEAKKSITLTLDEAARKFLIETAKKRSQYGARELKHRVRRYVTEKLIRAFDNETLRLNDSVIGKLETVDGKEEIVFYLSHT